MHERRMREIEEKGILNFAEAAELARLRDEQAWAESDAEKRRLELEKEREGKQAFLLTFREGNIFQHAEDMEEVKREIWAANATDAAEEACRIMMNRERHNPTGVAITDALSCRLDVFQGDQLQEHEPIWVSPYGIAPSQIANGGPIGFAEKVFEDLTGKGLEMQDGRMDLRD